MAAMPRRRTSPAPLLRRGSRKRADKREEAAGPAGLPAPAHVVSERDFVSPRGNRYRILTTIETDPDDGGGA
jgi:hypothetical protein